MNKSVLALAALAGAVVSVPALAAPVSASVRTADLNLSSPAGRDTLARRISAAAKTLCTVEDDRSLKSIVEGNRCYRSAIASARSQKMINVGGGKAAVK